MSDSHAVVLLLGVISAGVVVMTFLLGGMLYELHRSVGHLNRLLVEGARLAHDTRHALGGVSRVMRHADRMAGHVEAVVRLASRAAMDTVEHLQLWKGQAQTFLAHRLGLGNGSRVEPRRRRRGSGT